MSFLYSTLYIVGIIASTFLGQILVCKVLDLFYVKVAKKTRTNFDDELIPLLKRVLGLAIWVIGLGQILLQYGVNLIGLTTTLGIGTIVISLIIKDSLANIIAGITIMFDKPFKISDEIKLPSGESGTILKIGLRRTKLKVVDAGKHAYLILPNTDVSKCKIVNYTQALEGDI